MALPVRPLGRTGVEVTALGFGAMDLRGPPLGAALSDREASRLLSAVLDSGINVIDTSLDYGTSEELIGRHVADRRDEYFLASKCGCRLELSSDEKPPYPHDFSPANIRAGVEQSLRRLRTDHLDLAQIHLAPSRTELEASGAIEELLALRDEGKIRFIGTAVSTSAITLLTEQIAMGVFDVFQIPYSAVQRECEDLITQAADAGAGVLVRGGVAHGRAANPSGWGQDAPSQFGTPPARARWEASGMQELLDGMSSHEFILRFTLSHPGLSSAIVGTDNADHVAMNLEIAARGPLPPDLYEEAKRRFPGRPVTAVSSL